MRLTLSDVLAVGSRTYNPSGSPPSAEAVRIDGDAGDVVNLVKTGPAGDVGWNLIGSDGGYNIYSFDSSAPGGGVDFDGYVLVQAALTVNLNVA